MNMSAAEHLARLIHQADPAVVTGVPGYGATQVFAAYRDLQKNAPSFSYHEEVAYTVAHGASLTGRRAVTLLKAHGLAKASNSVVDSLSAGTTAGFVPIVFNDASGGHSDSMLDAAELAEGLDLPCETSRPEKLSEALQRCFDRSARKRLPYALIVEAEEMTAPISSGGAVSLSAPPPYSRSITHHLLSPLLAEFQHQVLEAKKLDHSWQDLPPPRIPHLPDDFPAEWHDAIRSYMFFFDIFSTLERDITTGDTGLSSLFGLPPYHSVDITTYMGGSIPLALGAYCAGHENSWALTGDFSFLAAGHLGLVEAKERGIPLNVVIFVNGEATATGRQPVSLDRLREVLAGYRSSLRHVADPRDPSAIRDMLQQVPSTPRLEILLLDYTGELNL